MMRVVFEFSMPRTITPIVERPERAYSEWVDAGVDVVIDDDDDAERLTPGQTVRSRPTPVTHATPVLPATPRPLVPPTTRIVTAAGTVVRSQSSTVTLRPAVPPQLPVTAAAAVSTQIEATLRSAIPPQPTPAAPSKNYSNPMWGQTTSGELISVRWNRKLRGNYSCWCPKCNNPFTQRNDLKRHLESNCSLIPAAQKVRYMCEEPGCTRDFSTKQYRNEHLHQEHLKKYLYVCSGCNKGFYKHVNFYHHKNSCLGALQQK